MNQVEDSRLDGHLLAALRDGSNPPTGMGPATVLARYSVVKNRRRVQLGGLGLATALAGGFLFLNRGVAAADELRAAVETTDHTFRHVVLYGTNSKGEPVPTMSCYTDGHTSRYDMHGHVQWYWHDGVMTVYDGPGLVTIKKRPRDAGYLAFSLKTYMSDRGVSQIQVVQNMEWRGQRVDRYTWRLTSDGRSGTVHVYVDHAKQRMLQYDCDVWGGRTMMRVDYPEDKRYLLNIPPFPKGTVVIDVDQQRDELKSYLVRQDPVKAAVVDRRGTVGLAVSKDLKVDPSRPIRFDGVALQERYRFTSLASFLAPYRSILRTGLTGHRPGSKATISIPILGQTDDLVVAGVPVIHSAAVGETFLNERGW